MRRHLGLPAPREKPFFVPIDPFDALLRGEIREIAALLADDEIKPVERVVMAFQIFHPELLGKHGRRFPVKAEERMRAVFA
jgi:hypothetical protein